jgi:hypothetical protein
MAKCCIAAHPTQRYAAVRTRASRIAGLLVLFAGSTLLPMFVSGVVHSPTSSHRATHGQPFAEPALSARDTHPRLHDYGTVAPEAIPIASEIPPVRSTRAVSRNALIDRRETGRVPPVEVESHDVRQELAAMAAAQHRRAVLPRASNGQDRSSSDDRIATALFGPVSSPRPST